MEKSGTWSASETKELKRLWSEGNDASEIAEALGRKTSSIRGKLCDEGIIYAPFAATSLADMPSIGGGRSLALFPRLLLLFGGVSVFVCFLLVSSNLYLFVAAIVTASLITFDLVRERDGRSSKLTQDWTPERVQILLDLSDEGRDLDHIALKLGRSISSIRSKLVHLNSYNAYKEKQCRSPASGFEHASTSA